jgi:hypothetical protein
MYILFLPRVDLYLPSITIHNGRKLGDIQGNYTCYTHNGASVVDYNMTFFKRFESKAMVKIILPTPIVIYDVKEEMCCHFAKYNQD